MSSSPRLIVVLLVLTLLCTWASPARSNLPFIPKLVPIKGADDHYELHEWGVFTASRGTRWAKQDMLAEWASLPSFFRGTIEGRRLFNPSELSPIPNRMIVRKPVIFIHTKKLASFDITVTFPKGQPMVWWPPAVEPKMGTWGSDIHHLRFQGIAVGPEGAKTEQGARLSKIALLKVDEDHWLNHLRAVKASRVTVTGGHLPQGRVTGFADQFIYYDGVIPSPQSPTVQRTADGVILLSSSDHDWLDVFVMERTKNRVRVSSWIDRVRKGSQRTAIVWKERKDGGLAIKSASGGLQRRLTAAGLFEDESESLVKTWQPGLFSQQGISVFYRVDQSTYDKWLPLDAKPKPTKVVRVGLVIHPHLEPELESRVQRLIERLGSKEYAVREKAARELHQIGGPAFPWIEKGVKHSDPEIALRCETIIRRLDAATAMPRTVTNK